MVRPPAGGATRRRAGRPKSARPFTGDTYKGPTTKCLSCHDGLLASTDGMWFNRQFLSGSKYVAPPGSLNSGHEVAEGENMSKSHPVAMPYPLNGAPNTYNFVKNGTNIEPAEWVADPMASNKIKLYQDNGAGDIIAGTVAGKTGIECSPATTPARAAFDLRQCGSGQSWDSGASAADRPSLPRGTDHEEARRRPACGIADPARLGG